MITFTPKVLPEVQQGQGYVWNMIKRKIESFNVLKPFNCLLPVLSLSFSLTCRVNTLVCSVLLWSNKCNNNNAEITPYIPVLAGRNLHMSQTLSHQKRAVLPTNCTPKDAYASVFFFPSVTPHARHIRASFEIWGRPFRLSLFASFFLPFGVAMKGIQSTQLRCHISFLSFIRLSTCFFSIQPGTVAGFT